MRKEIDGQQYKAVSHDWHETRAGREVRLLVVETECPTCGRAFRFKTTQTLFKRGKLTRRCPIHRRPGLTVESERKWRERIAQMRSTPAPPPPAAAALPPPDWLN